MREPHISLITGARQVGKTTLCQRLVEDLRAEGITCSGLVTRHTDEHMLEVTELRSGESYPLTLPFDSDQGIALGRFRMDPTAIERGLCALKASFPTDVFVLDEIGPLELVHRQGWYGALQWLCEASYAMAYVVVRPELLSLAIALLDAPLYTVIHVTQVNRAALPRIIRQHHLITGSGSRSMIQLRGWGKVAEEPRA